MSSYASMAIQRELEKIGRGGPYPPKPMGEVFFVNHFTGNDDHDGQNKDSPLKTITEALTRCVNARDDVILVKDAWNIAEETWPILVNKTRVHIIGLSHMGGKYVALLPPDDTAAFYIGAPGNGSEIAGFSLGGGNAHGCIELDNPIDLWIHDNLLGNQLHLGGNTPLYGIWNPSGRNASNVRIERNRFLGSTGVGQGGISGNGIEDTLTGAAVGGTFRNSEIVDNIFTCLAYAIRLQCPGDALIEHNKIMCPADDVVGRGIHLTGARGLIIDNNKAGDNGTADMTNNPYYDNSVDSNAWLCNQNGVTYVFPS